MLLFSQGQVGEEKIQWQTGLVGHILASSELASFLIRAMQVKKNMLKKGAARFTVSGKNVTQATNHSDTFLQRKRSQAISEIYDCSLCAGSSCCLCDVSPVAASWMDGKQIHAVKIGLRKAPPLNLVVACCQVVLRRHGESHDVPALTARSW